jgi:phage terminase small subunit
MGVLRNIRHEAFAQAIATGHSSFKAHEIAGFSPDRANAGRLRHRDDISRRVDEILAARTKAVDKALMSAAERVGLDEEWVLRKLRMNAVMAMRAGDRAAANRSIELIGKHLGMFIERKQVEIAYVDDADEYLARIIALVENKVIDNEPPAIDYEPAEPDDSVH